MDDFLTRLFHDLPPEEPEEGEEQTVEDLSHRWLMLVYVEGKLEGTACEHHEFEHYRKFRNLENVPTIPDMGDLHRAWHDIEQIALRKATSFDLPVRTFRPRQISLYTNEHIDIMVVDAEVIDSALTLRVVGDDGDTAPILDIPGL